MFWRLYIAEYGTIFWKARKMEFKLSHNLLQDKKSKCTFKTFPSSADIRESLEPFCKQMQTYKPNCIVPWLSATKNHISRNYTYLWHVRLILCVQNILSFVPSQSQKNAVHISYNYSFKMHFNPSFYRHVFKVVSSLQDYNPHFKMYVETTR